MSCTENNVASNVSSDTIDTLIAISVIAKRLAEKLRESKEK